MTAGLTDRVWTLREVLIFRVPPWPQPVGLCEQEGGVGNGKGRSPEQATRIRTACFEDVNPVQQTAVLP